MQNAPAFWKTDLETIESWAQKARRAQTWSLCKKRRRPRRLGLCLWRETGIHPPR